MHAARSGPFLVALVVGLVANAIAPSPARAGEQDVALQTLRERVAADARAGRPLVVQVHTALCSNDQIRCGGHGLGDGDNLDRNLYWATTGGTRGWFGRRGSGWREARLRDGEREAIRKRHEGLLDARVWTRDVPAGETFRQLGVRNALHIYVVAFAWRGAAIDRAIDAYAADLFGSGRETVHLDDHRGLDAGGAAHIVAYVGHSRWMDLEAYTWPGEGDPPAPVKGTLAVACMTRQYVSEGVVSPRRVALLFTRDLVFAGSMPVDGALQSFAAGGSLAAIRDRAVQAYAIEEQKPAARVASAFTNPSDRRW